jgi:hypothetical protein
LELLLRHACFSQYTSICLSRGGDGGVWGTGGLVKAAAAGLVKACIELAVVSSWEDHRVHLHGPQSVTDMACSVYTLQ